MIYINGYYNIVVYIEENLHSKDELIWPTVKKVFLMTQKFCHIKRLFRKKIFNTRAIIKISSSFKELLIRFMNI